MSVNFECAETNRSVKSFFSVAGGNQIAHGSRSIQPPVVGDAVRFKTFVSLSVCMFHFSYIPIEKSPVSLSARHDCTTFVESSELNKVHLLSYETIKYLFRYI